MNRFIPAAALLLAALALRAAEPVAIGRFSAGNLDGWQGKSFAGETRYDLVENGNRQVLRARSQAAASGLFLEKRVDLDATPYLNWSWRIDATLGDLQETTKAGDDYAARLYVVVDGGFAFWRTRALNYVWASRQAQGASWPNAFVGDNAMMLALRSGDARAGQWVREKRNVREDFRRLFDRDQRYIDAVALMTDTDNSGRSATAYYGDIWFSAD